jgi:hypothetical protein
MNTFEKLKKGGRGERIFQILSLSSLLLKKHNPHSEDLLGPQNGAPTYSASVCSAGFAFSFRIFSFFSSFSSTTENLARSLAAFLAPIIKIKEPIPRPNPLFRDFSSIKRTYGQCCRKTCSEFCLENVQNSADFLSAQISSSTDFSDKNMLNFLKIYM